MKKTVKPLVVGNWKMNPDTLSKAKKTFIEIRKGLSRAKDDVEIVIAAPFPYLTELHKLAPSKRVLLAAQNVSPLPSGAHTGEVATTMVKSVGVTHVIIGHSERRAMGETDEVVQEKTKTALAAGLTTVVCVGEESRDSHGDFFSVIETQITIATQQLPKAKLKQLVIAYEPIWAIGTGKTATPEDVHEMKLFIQKVLTDLFGRSVAAKVRIIYGGSVKAENVDGLVERGGVDGFLPGGASLKPKEFITIVKAAMHLA